MQRRPRSLRVDKEPETKPDEPTISRPRRIDWEKKLIILQPEDISSLENLQARMQSAGVERFVNGMDTIDDASLLYLQSCEMESNPFVPIPDVEVKDIGSSLPKGQLFKRPKSYITFDMSKSPGLCLDYDMDSEDEMWLTKYNKNKSQPLREILFEYLYSVVEYESTHNYGFVTTSGILEKWEGLNVENGPQENDIKNVIEYWKNKKKDSLKGLEAPILEKEKTFYELKNLKKIRVDFEKLRVIVDLIAKRERIKKKWINVHFDQLSKKKQKRPQRKR